MAKQTIGLGTVANDGTGDPARTAFGKVNDNFDELYAVGSVAPAATGVAATDTDALQAWITAAGAGATLHLRSGTYVIDKYLQLLSGQKFIGGGATLTRPDQVSTTTDTDVTSGVTTSITVADSAGFRAGQLIVLQTGAATNYTVGGNTIQSVVGNVITVTSSFVITSTNQFNVYLVGDVLHGADDVEITAVSFDGNRANWTFNRWDCVTEIRPMGKRVRIHNNSFTDIPCEGVQESSVGAFSTINTATNPVAVGDTTLTVADGSVYSVDDFVVISTSGTAAKSSHVSHVVTDVSANVLTIKPGALFAENSGSLDVVILGSHNEYSSNRFRNVGGNPFHLSGSTGTKVARNSASNVNLDSNSGHRGGLISWSWYCLSAVVTDNYVNISYSGIGNISGVHGSGAVIANNVCENATDYAMYIHSAITTPFCSRDIRITNNTFNNCASLWADNTGSTTDTNNYVLNLLIEGNHFYKTELYLDRTRDVVVTGNHFYARGTWTDGASNPRCIRLWRCNQLAITKNVLVGGYYGIKSEAACSNVRISDNTLSQQYSMAIQPYSSSEVGWLIDGNTIINDSNSIGTGYRGIYINAPLVVRNNTIRLAIGYGIRSTDGTVDFVVQGNTVKAAATYCIRVGATSTGYIVTDNTITSAVVDGSGAGAPARVANNDVITIA